MVKYIDGSWAILKVHSEFKMKRNILTEFLVGFASGLASCGALFLVFLQGIK